MKLIIDFETRSRADLPAVGQHIYARHESTEVMCLGWKIIGEKKSEVLTMPQIYTNDGTSEFRYAVKHAEHVVAHNAAFEQAMWSHCLLNSTAIGPHLPDLPPEKWICTLSLCSILALPRALEKAGAALNLDIKKDMEGRRLLLQMCKPRRPINDIQKWIEWVESDDALKRLYEYCRVDLFTEEALFNKLAPYKPFTKFERDLWILDQKINQRGFSIDHDLVARTLGLIKQEETELTKELQLKTFGWVKTTKQVKNFRDFLKDQGFDIPNLQKKTVDDTLLMIQNEGLTKNETVIEVLKIRQSLGKSSTSKYEAFTNRMDHIDGRVRDNLLYHGASTGRWSGAGVQPQNFPRGTVKINERAIKELETEDLHMLRILYGRPMDLFSSALRSMITASPGKELFCADFSSIEARVLLWVAGDASGIKEYENGLDTYITMAGTVFQIPWQVIEKEYKTEGYSEKRQLGKKVILACFEKNTRVLTNRGFVRIIDVRSNDKLWDGVEWVSHNGVVCQGKRKTINLFGVKVTPDHKILTPSGWEEAYQVQKGSTKFLKSVTSLANLPFVKLLPVKGAASLRLKFLVNVALEKCIVSIPQIYSIKKAPVVMFVRRQLQQIQINYFLSTPQLCPTIITEGVCSIGSARYSQDVIQKQVSIMNTMGKEELQFSNRGVKIGKNFLGILSVLKDGTSLNLRLTELKLIRGINLKIFVSLLRKKIWETAERFPLCKKKSTDLKNVFDILNVGPRNRFTIMTSIGPMIVHNCGYQMGVKKFIQSCKDDGLIVPESTAVRAHAAFKEKYPLVPKVWGNYEKAAIFAVMNPGKKITINKVTWYTDREFLFAQLPSGRRLAYHKPQIKNEATPWGEMRPKLYIWTVDSKTKQWVQRAVYGGLLTENIVQAISRDCMAESMVRCEDNGYDCLITVHDENLTERDIGEGSLEDFDALMSQRPTWGQDIPLKVSSWVGSRYKK